MEATRERERAGRRPLPVRIVYFVLRWLIKVLVLGIVAGWRHKRVVALVVVAGLVSWWVGSGRGLEELSFRPAEGSQGARYSENAAVVPPARAAEEYLRGQSQFDAQAMWDALSDQMKRASGTDGGLTLSRLAQQLEQRKQSGLHYDRASYVGGYLAPDGRGFYWYVVEVSSGTETNLVPFTFSTDQEGKILRIE